MRFLRPTPDLFDEAQRIVLYARDRGCTAPGCTVPGYYSEVHHVTDYAKCRCTDVNDLTRAEIEGRKQALQAIKALNHFAPGF